MLSQWIWGTQFSRTYFNKKLRNSGQIITMVPSGNLTQLLKMAIYSVKMVIFHSYVKLPEGTTQEHLPYFTNDKLCLRSANTWSILVIQLTLPNCQHHPCLLRDTSQYENVAVTDQKDNDYYSAGPMDNCARIAGVLSTVNLNGVTSHEKVFVCTGQEAWSFNIAY